MSDTTTSITSTTSSSGTKRVTGLYSSMDVNAMVSASLTNEQTRVDNMKKKLDYAKWQKEAQQEINTLVSDFQNKYFSWTSSTNLLSSSSLNLKTTTITGSNAVKVTAGSSATVANFEIIKATKANTAKVTTSSIKDADYTGMKTDAGKEVNENNATVKQLAQAMGMNLNISKTVDREVEVDKVDENGEKVLDENGNAVKEKKTVTDEYITININGTDVDIDANGTLSSVLSAVNSAVDSEGNSLGVKMTYNAFSMKFDISATAAGEDENFTISGNDGLFFGTNGLLGDVTTTQQTVGEGESATVTTVTKGSVSTADAASNTNSSIKVTAGTNSFITIKDDNGDVVSYSNPTNAFTVAGYTFNIKEDMDVNNGDESVKVELGTDVDGMVEKITNFVNDYNALIKTLNDKVTEKRNYDYDPLTDAEKKEVSDDELEELEEKAKAGILYGDSNIRSLLSNMRSALNKIETDSGLKLSDIGIKTGNYFTSSTSGALEIDETKLRTAIENNSAEVAELFTKASSTKSDGTKSSGGISTTFKDLTSSFVTRSKNVTISNITNRISSYEDRLETLQDWFAKREDALYTQFAQLEVLLAQMDSSASMFYQ